MLSWHVGISVEGQVPATIPFLNDHCPADAFNLHILQQRWREFHGMRPL